MLIYRLITVCFKVSSLSKKYAKALDLWEVSRDAFDELDAAADPQQRDEWKMQEETAMRNRESQKSSMDIFEAKTHKGR
jgi:hypothetical protein